MILAKKVKKKLPQKIKLDFSSNNQNWITIAQAAMKVKFLKFSTKNDYSFNISKVTSFTTPKIVTRFSKIFKSKNKQPQKKKFYPF